MKKKDVQVTESESVSEVTFLTIFLHGPGLRRKERVEKKCRFLFSLIPKLCFSRLKDPIQFPAECTFRASHGSGPASAGNTALQSQQRTCRGTPRLRRCRFSARVLVFSARVLLRS